MRISSYQLFNNGIEAIQRQQADNARTQLQLGSGRRILAPSDDPGGAVQTLEFQSRIDTTKQFQRNGTMAEQRLRMAETTLDAVGSSIHRVRELVLAGMNASQTNETRSYMAEEVRQIAKQVLQLANTREANGEYIFAGYNTLQMPFAADPDALPGESPIRFLGDPGQREVQISPVRKVAVGDSGKSVFMDIRDGNRTFAIDADPNNLGSGIIGVGSVVDPQRWSADAGDYTVRFGLYQQDPNDPNSPQHMGYTVLDANGAPVNDANGDPLENIPYVEGGSIEFNGIQFSVSGEPAEGDSFAVRPSMHVDMFKTFEDIARALEAPRADEVSQARQMNALNHGLQQLDNTLENTLKIRATLGTRLQAVEEQRMIHDNQLLQLETSISEIRDLDYAEAISRFQLQLTGLQAAQQSYTQMQKLSLFNYL